MTTTRQRENWRSVIWAGKSWTVRLTVVAVLACLSKGIVDLIFGKSLSEEITFLIAVAIPGGILIGSVIDIIQKTNEKEKFKSHRKK